MINFSIEGGELDELDEQRSDRRDVLVVEAADAILLGAVGVLAVGLTDHVRTRVGAVMPPELWC